jgi:PGF-pre-PGF domain-containing protein
VKNNQQTIVDLIRRKGNHRKRKRVLTYIITIILLLTLFSTVFIPVLSAADRTLLDKLPSDPSDRTPAPSPTTVTTTPPSSKPNPDSTPSPANPSEDDTSQSTPADDAKDPSDTTSDSPPTSSTSSNEPDSDTTSNQPTKDSTKKKDVIKKIISNRDKTDTTENNSSYIPADSSTTSLKNDTFLDETSSSNNNANAKSAVKRSIRKHIFEEKNDEPEENTVKKIKSRIGNISKDEIVSVVNKRSSSSTPSSSARRATLIEKVEFRAATAQKNVELSVKNLKEKPEEVKKNITRSNNSTIYEYLDIKLTANDTYIGESGIESMNFTFTITKEWIKNESIDKHTVIMMRYHNDTWQELNTTYVNETDEEIRFKALTPGLSVFAVVGDKVVEDTDEIIVQTINMPWWMPVSVIGASTAALGLVIFKKRFIYTP